MEREKIYILNRTFEKEYGYVVSQDEKTVTIELENATNGDKFTRVFSKKTGKAFRYHLKIYGKKKGGNHSSLLNL